VGVGKDDECIGVLLERIKSHMRGVQKEHLKNCMCGEMVENERES